MGSTHTLHIAAEHPAFEGHFPGAPLLPGVVLLDEMLRAVVAGACADVSGSDAVGLGAGGSRASGWTIATAKFLHPVRPGETLTFEHAPLASGGVRFTIRSAGRAVASGTLIPRIAVHESDHGHQAG